jgi:hypothetical protein
VEFLAPPTAGYHQAGCLQDPEVLHHPVAGHLEAGFQGMECLPVVPEELIQKITTGGVGKGLEYGVHSSRIGDLLVTCL